MLKEKNEANKVTLNIFISNYIIIYNIFVSRNFLMSFTINI